MVLRLKPIGKLATSKKNKTKKRLSTRQNQGLAWSYGKTSYLLDRTKVLHGPQTQTYGETSYLLDRTKVLHGSRTQAYEETSYFQRKKN